MFWGALFSPRQGWKGSERATAKWHGQTGREQSSGETVGNLGENIAGIWGRVVVWSAGQWGLSQEIQVVCGDHQWNHVMLFVQCGAPQ